MTRSPLGEGRWLVVGAAGMLGTEVVAALSGRDVTALMRADLDIANGSAVIDSVQGYDVVVNCAAWTAVDAAETDEASAFTANAIGPANLARACAASGAWLVHISTDYVFAGGAATPYNEDADVAPRTAYGRTKAAGEQAVRTELPQRSLILRTAWLYGREGPSFVRTIWDLEAQRETLDVVDDQRGQPTNAQQLARRIVAAIDVGASPGIYHATAAGATTWYDLARRVFELKGANPNRIHRTTTDPAQRPARRPAYSVLGHDRWQIAGLDPMADWSTALDESWDSLVTAWTREKMAT